VGELTIQSKHHKSLQGKGRADIRKLLTGERGKEKGGNLLGPWGDDPRSLWRKKKLTTFTTDWGSLLIEE